MLGAIIGDIVGSRWEFNPTNDYNFELFSDKNSFTDDTICTIAVADALLHGSDDYGKFIHEWCRRYPHPMGGYGGRFKKWVESDHPKPYGSYGNGSAMRVSPIGWWFEQPSELSGHAKKSAECTHNHEEGIIGAVAVTYAIRDCRILRQDSKGKPITENDILWGGLDHAIMFYCEFPQNFKLDIEEYRNKFDETCQGTVPVALWIVLHSRSFEDAIRQAVSLGADADTLGAIVGSIAEALWGIPKWMKEKALSYLPDEMKSVAGEFHTRLKRLRKLSERCQFYGVGDFKIVEDKDKLPCDIEREWAQDLARSYTSADTVRAEMVKRFPMETWQNIADGYDLPVSLVGYIARHILTSRHKTPNALVKFLKTHYYMRIEQGAKKKEEKIKKQEFMTIMYWKLGLGNANKIMFGESPLPDKSKVATAANWHIEPMPNHSDAITDMPFDFSIPVKAMDVLRRGHIPEAMEDHWFMYCDEEYIRYYRSWTGMCAFEAHYKKEGEHYHVDRLKMNHALAEFGVNGDESGAALFCYLVIAECGGDAECAWQDYLQAWDRLVKKYAKKN